jgi:hypothetical protein
MRVLYNLVTFRDEAHYTRIESTVDILSRVVLVLGILFMACAGAKGSTYSLSPSPADLNDLDHGYYYTWGIDRPWNTKESVTSVTLSFSNIYNWDNSPNVLYIHLLDYAKSGVKSGTDTTGGDEFNGQGTMLITYTNLSNKAQNLSYSFTLDQIKSLNLYAADGRFGLGFDPDCHFYNNGVTLAISTGIVPVPEPQTLVLLALGSVGWIRRVAQNKKARWFRPSA